MKKEVNGTPMKLAQTEAYQLSMLRADMHGGAFMIAAAIAGTAFPPYGSAIGFVFGFLTVLGMDNLRWHQWIDKE